MKKAPHLTLNISQINTPATSSSTSAVPAVPGGSYTNNYCLYKKEIEREVSRSPSSDPKGEEIEVKLQIEYTDLDSNEEKNLQKYIIHKANRNLIYNNGQIGILPTIPNKPATSGMTICYYSLLEVTGIPSDESAESSSEKQEYIICLICEVESDEGFALFRSDLGAFCEKVQELLIDVKVNKSDPESLQDHLSSWYSYTIEYISRCIDTAQEKLAVIIHAALMEKTIYLKKQAGQNAIVEDISKFIKCLSLSALVNGSALIENKPDNSHMYIIKDNESPTIDAKSVIIFIDSMYNLQIKYEGQPNVFAVQLAEELRNLPKDPLTIRNVLEQQKLKVLQELNQLRKGLEQARLNNYALYRCYRLLKGSENADVLMSLLAVEKGDPVSVEVLEVLQKCFSSA